MSRSALCFVVTVLGRETFRFSGTLSVSASLVWKANIDFQGTLFQLLFSFEFWITEEFGGFVVNLKRRCRIIGYYAD